jgi:hypothetical protein
MNKSACNMTRLEGHGKKSWRNLQTECKWNETAVESCKHRQKIAGNGSLRHVLPLDRTNWRHRCAGGSHCVQMFSPFLVLTVYDQPDRLKKEETDVNWDDIVIQARLIQINERLKSSNWLCCYIRCDVDGGGDSITRTNDLRLHIGELVTVQSISGAKGLM